MAGDHGGRRCAAAPPYDRSRASDRLTAALQALGTPRLQEANALTSERLSIPLNELADGRITGLLSVIDRWIENVLWGARSLPGL